MTVSTNSRTSELRRSTRLVYIAARAVNAQQETEQYSKKAKFTPDDYPSLLRHQNLRHPISVSHPIYHSDKSDAHSPPAASIGGRLLERLVFPEIECLKPNPVMGKLVLTEGEKPEDQNGRSLE
jgi:hypothetical protein